MFDDAAVISVYTMQQGIEDGLLVEVFKKSWDELTGGKPLVATRGIYAAFSLAALREIWNEFVEWNTDVKPTLPVEEQLFTTRMNDKKIWVLEDGSAYTILFPDEY